MDIPKICNQYFSGFQEIRNFKNNSPLKNLEVILKILSYLTVLIPLGFGIASLLGRVSKKTEVSPLEKIIIKKSKDVLDTKNTNLKPDMKPKPNGVELHASKKEPSFTENLVGLDDLISKMANINPAQHHSVSSWLQSSGDLFQLKSQEIAKGAFKKAMDQVLGSQVYFVDASGCEQCLGQDIPGHLDEKLFVWKETSGVQNDIVIASLDDNAVHLFSVASQYNCTESSTAVTPKLGGVMLHSAIDSTQGPLAQRTNPITFELVNAFLAHLGYNMMDKALPESIGKTYETEIGKKRVFEETSILHGYLQPAEWSWNDGKDKEVKAAENLKSVVDYLKSHLGAFETICYSSKPLNGGKNPVYLILAAAPCLSGPRYPAEVNDLQYYAALANFTTQFKQLLQLSVENPDKKSVLHVTLPGLGVFGNDPACVARAFKNAALTFQNSIIPEQKDRFLVELDIYNPDNNFPAMQVVNELQLKA